MAVAVDNSQTANTGTTAANSVTSAAFTIAAGATKAVIFAFIRNTASQTVGSASVGGSAASQVSNGAQSNGVACRIEAWEIANPPTGSVTFTVTLASGATARFDAVCVSITGGTSLRAQSTGNAAIASGTSTSATVTATSAAGDLVLQATAAQEDASGTLTIVPGASSGQTAIVSTLRTGTTGASDVVGAASYIAATGASQALTSTLNTSRAWATIGVAVTPTVGATASLPAQSRNRNSLLRR